MRHTIRHPGSILFALLFFYLATGSHSFAQVHVNGHVVTTDSVAVRGAVVRMRSMNDSGEMGAKLASVRCGSWLQISGMLVSIVPACAVCR